jgi:ketosteroid isomerase-like protein
MSQENVEIVRAAFDAWNAGDMDGFFEPNDPDVVWRTAAGWPEPGPYFGREAVMRFVGQLRDTWDADALEPVGDFIGVADHVLVRFIWHGMGRGPESNMHFTGAFTVRRGKIVFVEFFWSHAEALEAVGLSEQDAHADS